MSILFVLSVYYIGSIKVSNIIQQPEVKFWVAVSDESNWGYYYPESAENGFLKQVEQDFSTAPLWKNLQICQKFAVKNEENPCSGCLDIPSPWQLALLLPETRVWVPDPSLFVVLSALLSTVGYKIKKCLSAHLTSCRRNIYIFGPPCIRDFS